MLKATSITKFKKTLHLHNLLSKYAMKILMDSLFVVSQGIMFNKNPKKIWKFIWLFPLLKALEFWPQKNKISCSKLVKVW